MRAWRCWKSRWCGGQWAAASNLLRLLRELGLQGGIEDAGRVIVRRLLGRFGPARRAQRRAVIMFAQNTATLDKIRTAGDLSVLTNATVIDLGALLRTCGPRTREVFVIGRLIRWKGPMLRYARSDMSGARTRD